VPSVGATNDDDDVMTDIRHRQHGSVSYVFHSQQASVILLSLSLSPRQDYTLRNVWAKQQISWARPPMTASKHKGIGGHGHP